MSLHALLMSAFAAALLGPAQPDACQPVCPRKVAWWAIPSDTGAYVPYRVGGGCPRPLVADPPSPTDGTWGWDYVGRWFHRNVILGWWHGRRQQGGTGAYATDGPGLNHGEATLPGHHD
jgi:hypothetical protein